MKINKSLKCFSCGDIVRFEEVRKNDKRAIITYKCSCGKRRKEYVRV